MKFCKEKKPNVCCALLQAKIRYAGTTDPLEVRTSDSLGHHFIGGRCKLFGKRSMAKLKLSDIDNVLPGFVGFSMARSRIGDSFFEDFEGKQIVNLAPGFCTRTIRYKNNVNRSNKAVFELDSTEILEKKKKVLKLIDRESVERTKYVPVDLKSKPLHVLVDDKEHGYLNFRQTLFIWEGGTMFSSPQAVDENFQFIQRNSAKGSLIVFDFVFQDYIDTQGLATGYYGGSRLYDASVANGKPFSFGIERGHIKQWLAERKYELVSYWDCHEIERVFLTSKTGNIVHKASGPMAICIARVK